MSQTNVSTLLQLPSGRVPCVFVLRVPGPVSPQPQIFCREERAPTGHMLGPTPPSFVHQTAEDAHSLGETERCVWPDAWKAVGKEKRMKTDQPKQVHLPSPVLSFRYLQRCPCPYKQGSHCPWLARAPCSVHLTWVGQQPTDLQGARLVSCSRWDLRDWVSFSWQTPSHLMFTCCMGLSFLRQHKSLKSSSDQ